MAYSDIDKPSDYFNTITYTGDGTSPKSITGVGFQPDWVWVKRRNGTPPHVLYDIVRGVGKQLISNDTSAESTNNEFGYISAFESDGFEATAGSTSITRLYGNGGTYVAWNWLAGGTASSNTDGDITSQVSANTTSGFSIVGFTGTGTDGNTVGHGLSQAPELVITKSRDDAHSWYTFGFPNNSAFAANGSNVKLNVTDAMVDSTAHEMSIGSSVITIDDSGQINGSGSDYIYYCFHSVKGYSKFGSYTGNGSTDGPFIYTGFKPAFIIFKQTNTARSWQMFDNTRNTFNPVKNFLLPNSDNVEDDDEGQIDFVSNGFKINNTDNKINLSGGTYIYMCFAENPFVTSTGIPATAR